MTIQKRFGKIRKLPREKPVNSSFVIDIVAPFVISNPTPRRAVSVASVMMKGGKPSLLIPKAWKAPIANPMRSVMPIAAQIGKPLVSNMAIITLVNPTTAPTDKSMPAVMITNVSPMARIAVMAPCRSKF